KEKKLSRAVSKLSLCVFIFSTSSPLSENILNFLSTLIGSLNYIANSSSDSGLSLPILAPRSAHSISTFDYFLKSLKH
ncbi:hypothetical protein, partial [Pseudoalteromonas undina]